MKPFFGYLLIIGNTCLFEAGNLYGFKKLERKRTSVLRILKDFRGLDIDEDDKLRIDQAIMLMNDPANPMLRKIVNVLYYPEAE